MKPAPWPAAIDGAQGDIGEPSVPPVNREDPPCELLRYSRRSPPVASLMAATATATTAGTGPGTGGTVVATGAGTTNDTIAPNAQRRLPRQAGPAVVRVTRAASDVLQKGV